MGDGTDTGGGGHEHFVSNDCVYVSWKIFRKRKLEHQLKVLNPGYINRYRNHFRLLVPLGDERMWATRLNEMECVKIAYVAKRVEVPF